MLSLKLGIQEGEGTMVEENKELLSLKARIAVLENEVGATTQKDVWDKLSALSALFSGVIVAGIGLYATTVYNERQLDATAAQKERELAALELQTVETFFEHLSSNDKGIQKSSLEAIISLGDQSLAMKLAENLGGDGGKEFILEQTLSPDSAIANKAKSIIENINDSRVKKLDGELTYRLRFLSQLLVEDKVNDKVMSEVQNVLEQTPPIEQNYMVGGGVYFYEDLASKNVSQLFDELYSYIKNDRSAEVELAIDAVEKFQQLILSTPTREVALEEHIVGSVPDFQDTHIPEIKGLIFKFEPWLEVRDK